ncbi:MAG: 1,4-dihydroxy-2-naphthoate polyprenyltransferase [Nitriliruptoraceae bacterium]
MNAFVEAARPRTLPAAVAPVVVGTAAASRGVGELDPLRAGLALVVAVSLQIAVNYANDYFDGVRGIDTDARIGPRRVVAAGLVTPRAMRGAIAVALLVAGAGGFVLAALAGWELLLVGVAAILATLLYSGGPRPYASAALGEVMVFVFFGVVATAGSAYVQDERLTVLPLLASLPMGAFAVALLVVNNLRDIPTDRAVGKRTLAVILGEGRTRATFGLLIAGAYLSLAPIGLVAGSPWIVLPTVSVLRARRALEVVRDAPIGRELIAALGMTSRTQVSFAVLLTIGLLLSRSPASGGAA